MGKFKVDLANGNFFYLNSSGKGQENMLFWKGLSNLNEPFSMMLWMDLCRSAEVIVDVGANIGLYSLIAVASQDNAKIFGIEPQKDVFKTFSKNNELNKNRIHCLNIAVGEKDGSVDFFYDPSNLVISSRSPGTRLFKEVVKLRSLDSLVNEYGLKNIDLIKIDVEGFEEEVLKGFSENIFKFSPSMIVEVLEDDLGVKLENILDKKYRIFHIDEEKGLVERKEIRRISQYSRNYFLCSNEAAKNLQEYIIK